MRRSSTVLLCAILTVLAFSGTARPEGEGILAMTGQYTFFIRPDCGSGETYYQKLVPCRLEKTVPIARVVTPKYLVPHASIRGVPVMRNETPVGCAKGAGPCVECFPKPTRRPAINSAVVPIPAPVRIRDLQFRPKTVVKRVLRPQWFKVTDEPRPLRKVRKIHPGG